MGHVVLLGDSIFDNARYVPDRPPVIDQLRQALPRGCEVAGRAVADPFRAASGRSERCSAQPSQR